MRKTTIFAALLSLSVLLSACGNTAPAGNNGNQASSEQNSQAEGGTGQATVIKIASQTSLSGDLAEMGGDVKNGAEMAIKENLDKFKGMGFDLQFVPKDDKADSATGAANAKALATDPDVLAVVGHMYSGVFFAAGPTYESAGIAAIASACTNPGLSKNNWKTFHRISGTDDKQGPAAARFIVDQGKKTVYIVDDSSDYGKGVATEMEKKAKELGLSIIAHESVHSQEMEFNTLVTKIKASNADVVFYGGFYEQAGQFVKQLRNKQYNGMFAASDGINDPGFVKAAGEQNVKNVYFASIVGNLYGTPEGAAWARKYKEEYGKEPGAFGVYGYDGALVALNGLEKAIKDNGGKKPTREQVNKAISETKDFQGVFTVTTFDDKGDNINAASYFKSFENGKFPPIQITKIKE